MAGQLPVWAQGAASSALWQELLQPEYYEAQALRYTQSDLLYMCINRIAQMAARNAHRLVLFDPESPRDDETGLPTERIPDHPFFQLWRKPNAWDSTFELLEGTMIFSQIAGNAYWHADDGEAPVMRGGRRWVLPQKEPLALWPMRPDRIQIEPSAEKYIGAYRYEVGGETTYIDPSLVRHYKRFHPLKDFEGLSPMEPANFAVASDIAAQKSNWYLYRNSMRLSGIVESDEESVEPDQVDLMEKDLKEKYTGSPEKGHQVAFLWSGFKYKELGMKLRDAEFIEAQKMNRSRIFGVFGVHPAVVLSEDVNLANAKVGEYVTLKYTVDPALESIASDLQGLLGLWPDAPPAEAHFVGVVPQDRESETKVAEAKSRAAEGFIRSLGKEEGVKESQRQGVLTEDIDIKTIIAVPAMPVPPALPAPAPHQPGTQPKPDDVQGEDETDLADDTKPKQNTKSRTLNGFLAELGNRVDGALNAIRSMRSSQQMAMGTNNMKSAPSMALNLSLPENLAVKAVEAPPTQVNVDFSDLTAAMKSLIETIDTRPTLVNVDFTELKSILAQLVERQNQPLVIQNSLAEEGLQKIADAVTKMNRGSKFSPEEMSMLTAFLERLGKPPVVKVEAIIPPVPVQLTLLPPDGVERTTMVRDSFGNILYADKEFISKDQVERD